MEIRIKNGVVIVPDDFIRINPDEEFRKAEGASVLEYRNGDKFNMPRLVIPTLKYIEASDHEIQCAIYGMIRRYPEIGKRMRASMTPGESFNDIKLNHDVAEDGVWPAFYPLYKKGSGEYEYQVKADTLSCGACIIPDSDIE